MEIPNLTETNQPSYSTGLRVPLIVVVILLGTIAGLGYSYLESRKLDTKKTTTFQPSSNVTTQQINKIDEIKVGVIYGSNSKQFTDKAIGTLTKGGVSGEGTHTLERAGGVSQRAALTSSVLDLDLFIGKKVEVTGETNTSFKSGWLLDVGMVKVLE